MAWPSDLKSSIEIPPVQLTEARGGLRTLRMLGCNVGQGYCFAEAMSGMPPKTELSLDWQPAPAEPVRLRATPSYRRAGALASRPALMDAPTEDAARDDRS